MALVLHNTLTRSKELFEPIDPSNVRMYVCGPTVYQRIHVGNARPLVVFDVLYRVLLNRYARVTYVRNITDIDDKIIVQAAANGERVPELTERTTAQFHEDCEMLGLCEPTMEPRATDHIDRIIRQIIKLVKSEHAYEAEGHVLFHVPSMPDYGALSGRNRDEMVAGARVEVAPYKRDPADFVLWKPSTPGTIAWESPWGRGRPGWHIECSTMSGYYLGVPFDIHGGGQDLIFPHHENEIAQTRCIHQSESMARYWLHNGFVDMSGEKMSKSLGNILTVERALDIVPGEAIRLWLLGAHYRQPLDCTDDALHEAKRTLDRFYSAIERAGPIEYSEPEPELVAALEDDLNTPRAIAVLHELLGQLNKSGGGYATQEAVSLLVASGALLGLLQQAPATWLRSGPLDSAAIEAQIEARLAARGARDYGEADRIRDELAKGGIILEDSAAGTTWRRA